MSGPLLGIIPARGGSKGFPGKNLAMLAGKPLIAHTIEAALASGVLARVVVSTDDPAIAAAAKQHGAEVPFLRPAELATDTAASFDVVKHALRFCENADGATKFDGAVLLQPTSPLRTAADIRGAIALWRESGAPSVVSVCEIEHPVAWIVDVAADGTFSRPFAGVAADLRAGRQSHAKLHRFNGALYVYARALILDSPTGVTPTTCAFIMPQERSVDIDTPLDLAVAAAILAHHK